MPYEEIYIYTSYSVTLYYDIMLVVHSRDNEGVDVAHKVISSNFPDDDGVAQTSLNAKQFQKFAAVFHV